MDKHLPFIIKSLGVTSEAAVTLLISFVHQQHSLSVHLINGRNSPIEGTVKQHFPYDSYSVKTECNSSLSAEQLLRTRMKFPALINIGWKWLDVDESMASLCFLNLCGTNVKSCLLVPES